ncbi:hypothetical protein DI09_49p210 [Mitosporidium daphniae]|uniref:Uncharacterized protein n=1 Tax=Mitosporidium daphniae TaxID=1485682 RepID=A0A098VTF4_9MICR|nr:uncharacterized protein DI09_49p210 [Mitosporidium daphniae]KGG50991.1 hypothetical protein DI09_49p210 [Mitosporidium daphniae]|eukprot:XP_013237418.1 uncharacterized protein DI09_49p210 [Mitosporidium daphniae]
MTMAQEENFSEEIDEMEENMLVGIHCSSVATMIASFDFKKRMRGLLSSTHAYASIGRPSSLCSEPRAFKSRAMSRISSDIN